MVHQWPERLLELNEVHFACFIRQVATDAVAAIIATVDRVRVFPLRITPSPDLALTM